MKTKILPISLLIASIFLFGNAKANETEPNDDRASANTFALNGNNNGKINIGGDQDWWKITTTADGKLDITLTPVSGKYIWIYLYDNNGTTQLASQNAAVTFTLSKDGLAPGTYYAKIVCYYAADTASYTMSNALTPPAQANDAEPDSTRAQAQTLNLNGGTTGHSGYYYNLHRDSVDWFKVTTNEDGLLRITLTPANSNYMWIYIYDNNGTTLLNSGNSYQTFNVSQDGLAPGTYYVKIKCYYTTDFAPYTISDSLFKPAQANDLEPNDSKATAIAINVNKSKTGHAGYYYNLQRDSSDWYKITTNTDGLLRVTVTPVNGKYMWIYIYDNNGTTLLSSGNSNIPFNVSADGLAAGTFYVKVKCYYNYDFAPYILSDSLFNYTNASDAEPDNKPYLAQTMPANGIVTGHVGFLNNSQRDTSDWWKINYTGTGALKVTAKFEPNKILGYRYIWMDIYKDTAAAALYSMNTITSSMTANFGALTQGYYFVRIRMYYNYEFESYSLTDTFTQVNIATSKIKTYDTVASCSSTNFITLTFSKSHPPYTVDLYRYGVLYDTKIAKSKSVTFNALPIGSYYAKAFGDGATGTAFGKSKTVSIVPTPHPDSTTNIMATQATLNWTKVACAKFDSIYYRVHGTTPWSTKKTNGNPSSIVLNGLTASTTYDWMMAAVDSANGIIAISPYSSILMFTTPASLLATSGSNNEESKSSANDKTAGLHTYPNPASARLHIQWNGTELKNDAVLALTLKDATGKTVWEASNIYSVSLKGGMNINVNNLPNGIYLLQMLDGNKNSFTKKIIISR